VAPDDVGCPPLPELLAAPPPVPVVVAVLLLPELLADELAVAGAPPDPVEPVVPAVRAPPEQPESTTMSSEASILIGMRVCAAGHHES
jgi:hypothetical protein